MQCHTFSAKSETSFTYVDLQKAYVYNTDQGEWQNMHHIWNSIANIIVVDGGICIHIRYDMSLFRKGCDVYTVAVCHSLHMIIPAHQILTDIQFSLAHGTPEHNTISQKFSHMVCGRRNGNNNMLVIARRKDDTILVI